MENVKKKKKKFIKYFFLFHLIFHLFFQFIPLRLSFIYVRIISTMPELLSEPPPSRIISANHFTPQSSILSYSVSFTSLIILFPQIFHSMSHWKRKQRLLYIINRLIGIFYVFSPSSHGISLYSTSSLIRTREITTSVATTFSDFLEANVLKYLDDFSYISVMAYINMSLYNDDNNKI